MAISPMLKHAIESFEHGLQYFLEDIEVSRKFALLHIDHAIELMVKEKVVQEGKSIYRKDGRTISIFGAFETLGIARIPETPRLEELHDFRNTVQHKGLTPDYYTTEFYVREAYQFIGRFMKDELGMDIEEHVPKTYIHLMEGTKTLALPSTSRIKDMLLNAEKMFSIGQYDMAVVSGFVALESVLSEVANETGRGITTMRSLIEFAQQSGLLDSREQTQFMEARAVRNKAVHGGEISKDAARPALDNINGLIAKITTHQFGK